MGSFAFDLSKANGTVGGSGASDAGLAGSALLATLTSGPALLAVFLLYVAICSSLRFRLSKTLRERFNFPDRASLSRMTHDEAQAILSNIIQLEFPLLYKTALQFAIFKTYGIPTISKTIVLAKSFSDPKQAPKRYEDTAVIFSEFSLNPPTSERCIQAIARMNFLHSSYIKTGHISNADLLYTLSVALLEPIRFIRLYEWRELNEMEVAALGTFWRGIGEAMHIDYKGYLSKESWKDGIDFVEDIADWSKRYEVAEMKPDPINVAPSRALVAMMTDIVPGFMKPFVVEIITVFTGDRLREAFLYPEPSALAAFIAHGTLLFRKLFLRYLALPRMTPLTFLEPDPKTGRIYHHDYLVDPWYVKPTFWNRWGPSAWVWWMLGGKLPGDGGDKFLTSGYRVEDLGPASRMGKGKEAVAEWEETLKRERSSGCPYAH